MIIEIYTRPGCHLCDEAKEVLRAAEKRFHIEIVEKNVETDGAWKRAFGQEVPVVFINGRKAFKYRIPPKELERYLQKLGTAAKIG